jgi:hypothetical protein
LKAGFLFALAAAINRFEREADAISPSCSCRRLTRNAWRFSAR